MSIASSGPLSLDDALAEIRRHMGADDADPRAAGLLRRALASGVIFAVLADGSRVAANHWRNGEGAPAEGAEPFYIPTEEWETLRGRLGPDRAEQAELLRRPTLSLADLARLSKIARPSLETAISPINSRRAEMKTAMADGKLPAARMNGDRIDQLAEVRAADLREWAKAEGVEWAAAVAELWCPASSTEPATEPKPGRKRRKADPGDDYETRRKIELVYRAARTRWPDKSKRPSARQMSRRLPEAHRQGYSLHSLYVILANKYPAAERLGMRFE